MVKGKLVFTKIIQDSQDYGSDDDHMISRVFFDLEARGLVYRDLYADVKQTVGTDYETAPLEVSFPRGYKGPLDYAAFREHVETYYRGAFGSTGGGIRFGPGVANIRMRDNTYISTKVVYFEVDPNREPSGW